LQFVVGSKRFIRHGLYWFQKDGLPFGNADRH
jgi:hypothetical protein